MQSHARSGRESRQSEFFILFNTLQSGVETLALQQCTVHLLERGKSAFHGFLWSRLLTEALLSGCSLTLTLFEDSSLTKKSLVDWRPADAAKV